MRKRPPSAVLSLVAFLAAAVGLALWGFGGIATPAAGQETTTPTTTPTTTTTTAPSPEESEEVDPRVEEFLERNEAEDPAFWARNPVVIGQDLHVRKGETVGNVFVFEGRVIVEGTVDGVVTAIRSPVLVTGTVNGEGEDSERNAILSWGRRVTLASTAVVNGDIWTNRDVNEEPGATVNGEVVDVDPGRAAGGIWAFMQFALFVFFWVVGIASLLALGFLVIWLAPRGLDNAYEAGRNRPGPVIGWGLLSAVAVPIVATVAMGLVLGLPLGLWILGAWALVYALGSVAAGYLVGRSILRNAKGRSGPWLLGWLILAVLYFVPFLNLLVGVCATIYGVGMLTVALKEARGGPQPAVPAMPAGPAPEPADTAESWESSGPTEEAAPPASGEPVPPPQEGGAQEPVPTG